MDPMNSDESVQAECPPDEGHHATSGGMIFLSASICAIARATADPGGGARSGVLVEALPGGHVRLTATDQRMLVTVEEAQTIRPEEYPPIPGLADAPSGAVRAVVPAQTCGALGKALGKRRKGGDPCEAVAAVKLSDAVVTIGTCNDGSANLQIVRPLAGEFPDPKQKIPSGIPRISLTLSIKVLSKLLKTCEGLLSDRSQVLRFDLFDDPRQSADGASTSGLAIRVVGVTEGGLPLVGAIAPVTLDAVDLSGRSGAEPDSRFGLYPDAGKRARDRRRRQKERLEASQTSTAGETVSL